MSDPLPTILDGIPLDVRSVSLGMDRAGFTFNPTSCEAMSVTGEAISTLNQTAALSNRFQVGGCQGLPFKPSLTASTAGKTSKANGASLTVKVAQKPGEANIHKVDLTLPTILPARLTTLQKACTEAQFNSQPRGLPRGVVHRDREGDHPDPERPARRARRSSSRTVVRRSPMSCSCCRPMNAAR